MNGPRTTALALLAALSLVSSCSKSETPSTDTPRVREAIAVEYVQGADLPVRSRPYDDAPVIVTYTRGTAVSILSHRGAWDEVRVADRSGWARAGALGDLAAEEKDEKDSLTPRFKVVPAPISGAGAHGEIFLEANVNADGEVIGVRLLENTTGSDQLAQRNVEALKSARFEPILQHGTRKPFIYDYTIHY